MHKANNTCQDLTTPRRILGEGLGQPMCAPAPAHPHQPGAGGGALSPLEAGMYVLLAVFCLAIATFVASCFVYASKHPGPGPGPARRGRRQYRSA